MAVKNGRKWAIYSTLIVVLAGIFSTAAWAIIGSWFHSRDSSIHHTFKELDGVYLRIDQSAAFDQIYESRLENIRVEQRTIKDEVKETKEDIKELRKDIKSINRNIEKILIEVQRKE